MAGIKKAILDRVEIVWVNTSDGDRFPNIQGIVRLVEEEGGVINLFDRKRFMPIEPDKTAQDIPPVVGTMVGERIYLDENDKIKLDAVQSIFVSSELKEKYIEYKEKKIKKIKEGGDI